MARNAGRPRAGAAHRPRSPLCSAHDSAHHTPQGDGNHHITRNTTTTRHTPAAHRTRQRWPQHITTLKLARRGACLPEPASCLPSACSPASAGGEDLPGPLILLLFAAGPPVAGAHKAAASPVPKTCVGGHGRAGRAASGNGQAWRRRLQLGCPSGQPAKQSGSGRLDPRSSSHLPYGTGWGSRPAAAPRRARRPANKAHAGSMRGLLAAKPLRQGGARPAAAGPRPCPSRLAAHAVEEA